MRSLVLLTIAGLGVWFAAATPSEVSRYATASCDRWNELSPASREIAVEQAISIAEELRVEREAIYGTGPWLVASWYGVRAQAVELTNAAFGSQFEEPTFGPELKAKATAGVRELLLRSTAAKALDVPACMIAHLVPDARYDSADDAGQKLQMLLTVLYK